jgi:EAL domain-containing protein (putative c-di-GMP-specific phosphodiesterase class I)
VAEGVETAEVMEALDALSCDTAQGYYISRPLPAQELSVSLRGPARKPSASRAGS